MKSLEETYDKEELMKLIFGMAGAVNQGAGGSIKMSDIMDTLKEQMYDSSKEQEQLEEVADQIKEAEEQIEKAELSDELEKRLHDNGSYIFMPVYNLEELKIAMKILMNRLWNGKPLFCIMDDKNQALTGLSGDSKQITFDKDRIDDFKGRIRG